MHRTYTGTKNGLAARQRAMARSSGKCQFCGLAEAEELHHWEYPKYTRESKLTEDHLIALCGRCHEIATNIRRLYTNGGDVSDFYIAVGLLVERLFTDEVS